MTHATERLHEEPPPPRSDRPRRRRRSSRRGSSSGKPRDQRLRLAYFTVAAVWGFLAGSAAILGGLAMNGTRVGFDPLIVGALVVAGAASLIGGGVVAAAYRNANDR